jgi:N-acetylglucosaminyl-diphospho-decaprenol L-rhamnosyltransferase
MIGVVVVTYRTDPDRLDATLSAIQAAGGYGPLIVVDTGGSANPVVGELIRMENRGYGAAVNVGIARAREQGATAFAVLNDDVVVRPGWLQVVSAELGDGVGAVQPKLLLADTDPPLVNSLGVAFDDHGAGIDIGDGEVDDGSSEAHDIAMFTGGAVLLSLGFVEATGGFDERFVLYYEDVDLALRGAELGWRYRIARAAVVEHARSSTTASIPDRTRYLQERNRLWVAARFGSPARYVRAVWLSVRRLRHHPRRVHARALVAGLAGTPRRLVERMRARRTDARRSADG